MRVTLKGVIHMMVILLIITSIGLSISLAWLYTLFLPDPKKIDTNLNETMGYMKNAFMALNEIKKENDKANNFDLSQITNRISERSKNKMIKGE